HLDRSGGFLQDFLGPFKSCCLQLVMWYYGIDHAHLKSFLGRVISPEKEYLPCALLTYHFGKVGRAVASIKTGHIRIGLFKNRMLLAGKGQIADRMQTMSAAYGPAGNHSDYDFGHKSDQALHL